MNLTIYIDVLFLLNLILDYIILSSTALFTGEKIKNKRLLFASCIGAVYSVIIFFPVLKVLNIIFLKTAVGLLIVFVAFKHRNLIHFLKLSLTYYIINALYGGGIYAFYNFTVLGSKMNYSNGIFYIALPLWAIILIAFFFYFITKLFAKISDGRITEKNINLIEIHFNNTKVTISSLFDTGNALYDPISLLPVVLLEAEVLKNKISSGVYKEILKGESSSLALIHNAYPEMKFRIIPFKDVTGKMTCIFAFKPQKVFNISNNAEIPNVLIGIVNTKLSSDESYSALLHSKT